MRLWNRYKETICVNWHLGATCFGGPAVQFQTVCGKHVPNDGCPNETQFHKLFVEELGWIDEPMVRLFELFCGTMLSQTQYQQIFGLSQALPGSASVKMLLCINAIRNGLVSGFLAFLMFR